MKLKSKGSGPLIIRNARLLGRKGVSVEVGSGELVVVKSDAFNPVMTVEQLMKQSLARIKRGGADEVTWQTDCEELSFAAEVDVFRLSHLDLDKAVEQAANKESSVRGGSDSSEIDKLVSKLCITAGEGSLIVVQASTSHSSMSFRFDREGAKDKVAEIVGELTREGALLSDLTFKLFSSEIRSRKELGTAVPLEEFALTESSVDRSSEGSAETFRSLDLAERYRSGALKWAKNSAARLLLVDSPRYLMDEKDSKELIEKLRRSVNPAQMCIVFEDTSLRSVPQLTSEQLSRIDECLLEFSRKQDRYRLIDWIGLESELAEQFAVLPDARRSGLTAKDFIRKTTRYPCPACAGEGSVTSAMGPFGDLKAMCANCSMTGFGENVLQVKLGKRAFRDVLCGEVSLLAEILKQNKILERLSAENFGKILLSDPLALLPELFLLALIQTKVL